MGGTRIAIAACVFSVCLSIPGRASADDLDPYPEGSRPDLSYLWDGGAIPFLWAPIAARIALDTYAVPRETPLLFSASEGGAAKSTWQVPGWGITALGGGLALGMIASGDDSRFYHVKGLAQSLATGSVVTAALKVTFGRYRPDRAGPDDPLGSRRSFPSGHATQAFAIATYTALFLRRHVFADLRGDRTLPWWEAATYGGILGAASALAGERVINNRHHLSDVGVGALFGTATSTLFFLYQDGRARDGAARESRPLSVAPTLGSAGTGVSMSLIW